VESPSPPCTGCFRSSRFSPIAHAPSSSPTIPSSWKRYGTLPDFISTRPIMRWCCASMRSARFTQPVLPMGLGYVEGVTHDYVRHGTTTLFAALDIATGAVFTECKPRHRHQEFLAFLRKLDECIPAELDVHLIVDNYGTHKHSKVRTWLAQRPRYQIHYTPTYSSWLNQVERWFALITQRAIRRGTFRSVKELVDKIDSFVQHYNRSHRPFVWTATADFIIAKIKDFVHVFLGHDTSWPPVWVGFCAWSRLASRCGERYGPIGRGCHRPASVRRSARANGRLAVAK
jgi:transposase